MFKPIPFASVCLFTLLLAAPPAGAQTSAARSRQIHALDAQGREVAVDLEVSGGELTATVSRAGVLTHAYRYSRENRTITAWIGCEVVFQCLIGHTPEETRFAVRGDEERSLAEIVTRRNESGRDPRFAELAAEIAGDLSLFAAIGREGDPVLRVFEIPIRALLEVPAETGGPGYTVTAGRDIRLPPEGCDADQIYEYCEHTNPGPWCLQVWLALQDECGNTFSW